MPLLLAQTQRYIVAVSLIPFSQFVDSQPECNDHNEEIDAATKVLCLLLTSFGVQSCSLLNLSLSLVRTVRLVLITLSYLSAHCSHAVQELLTVTISNFMSDLSARMTDEGEVTGSLHKSVVGWILLDFNVDMAHKQLRPYTVHAFAWHQRTISGGGGEKGKGREETRRCEC
jgi:hypothetical protein